MAPPTGYDPPDLPAGRMIFGMGEQRWHQVSALPLAIAGAVFVVSYSLGVFVPGRASSQFAVVAMSLVWVTFAIDYAISLYLAANRWGWFWRNLHLLLIVLLPALQPLRMLWALTVFSAIHRTTSAVMRERLLIMVIAGSAVLIYLASLITWELERYAPTARIVTYGDALWWSVMTITTVGYGDTVPVTPAGRAVSIVLMLCGVAAVGCITAILASWLIDVSAARRGNAPSTSRQVERLEGEVLQLEDEVRELRALLERKERDAPPTSPPDR